MKRTRAEQTTKWWKMKKVWSLVFREAAAQTSVTEEGDGYIKSYILKGRMQFKKYIINMVQNDEVGKRSQIFADAFWPSGC